jgi:transcriptional regulator
MMYSTPLFREQRLEVKHALIRAHPLGTLVTRTVQGLIANLIPFLIDPKASENGTLKGHVARANSQWREFDPNYDALVIFQGSQTYISPSWYETKRQTGKVVPTWNYVVVQAHGRLVIRDDPDWVSTQIRQLTETQESKRAHPWAVSDAPREFIEQQVRAIVGIEIPISRLEGKWKVSQNRPQADREGVVEGLKEGADDNGLAMAALVASALSGDAS